MSYDYEKATAELPILRDFIDFVNKQCAVYMDCLSGFEGNSVRITRQVARITFPSHKELRDGEEVIVWDSAEDPSQPDVIHQTIRRSSDYISDNSQAGFNEQQVCWSIIVFIFSYWDEEVRPAIAKIRDVPTNDIIVDALGDLRILRKAVIHNKGIVSAKEHTKLKVMQDIVTRDARLALSHDQMHTVFILLKRAIGEIISHYIGDLPGAPDWSKVVGVAIQNAGSRKN